jgi:hypothetical protein
MNSNPLPLAASGYSSAFRAPSLPLTALLLTWNETANIGRTLAALQKP